MLTRKNMVEMSLMVAIMVIGAVMVTSDRDDNGDLGDGGNHDDDD